MLRMRLNFLRPALLLPLAAFLLAACDGEKVEYDPDIYDIEWILLDGTAATGVAGEYGSLGVASPDNRPGGRTGAVAWTERDEETDLEVFWLFGGTGYDADGLVGPLNDLWKYEKQGDGSLQWTWVAGSATTVGATADYDGVGLPGLPGGRNQALGWIDADGALWLFGGSGRDGSGSTGRLNDLWTYADGSWTWVGGSSTADQAGIYGTAGTADPGNWPGSRYAAGGWVDDDGGFWLFGGNGFAAGSGCCWLNDLWKYEDGSWTWMKGSSSANAEAVYGTTGEPDDDNTPGARYGMAAWHTPDVVTTDEDDLQAGWIFGGTGADDEADRVVLNEIWRFDHESGDWIFILGSKGAFSAGSYGGRGQFAFTNVPPSRHRPVAWQTGSTLWMFGGAVEKTAGTVTRPNDLWRFDTVGWTWVGGASSDNPDGDYPELAGEVGQPGGREGGVGWVDDLGSLWLLGGEARSDFWIFPR
ncbi:MAG: hypothetical protein ACOY3X_07885 [Pseudomonadota bacterium]